MEGEVMSIRRVVPDITSDRLIESRAFYTGFLGFDIAMDMGWIVTFVSPTNPTAQVNVFQANRLPAGHQSANVTVEVADVDAVHERALSRGLQLVYPLTDEPWGVRRFFVRDPNGIVLNVMSHSGHTTE
jgi:catechol 2,3-dioxygenase-like lactoylglutathione lyase family enzyme